VCKLQPYEQPTSKNKKICNVYAGSGKSTEPLRAQVFPFGSNFALPRNSFALPRNNYCDVETFFCSMNKQMTVALLIELLKSY